MVISPEAGALEGLMAGPGPAVGDELKKFVGESYDIFMNEFEKAYGAGAEPDHGFAINFWDILTVSALAMEAAGEATPAAVSEFVPIVSSPPGVKVYTYADGRAALEAGQEIDFEGAGSDLNFDEYGNVYPPSSMFVVSGDDWEQVATFSPQDQADFLAR
jgi:branched-chain amino acid transport system substrate-binding protein